MACGVCAVTAPPDVLPLNLSATLFRYFNVVMMHADAVGGVSYAFITRTN